MIEQIEADAREANAGFYAGACAARLALEQARR